MTFSRSRLPIPEKLYMAQEGGSMGEGGIEKEERKGGRWKGWEEKRGGKRES